MERIKGNWTAKYSIIQALYWMSFCAIFSYSSVYLLDKGFSNTEIGLVIGISGGISALLQPLAGELADKSQHISLHSLVSLLCLLMLFMGAGLLAVSEIPVLTVLCYGMLIIFLQVLTPLVYSLGMACANSGRSLNFGLSRGIGSLCFAGISSILGVLVVVKGTAVIPIAIMVCYVGLFLGVTWFRYQEVQKPEKKMKEASASPDGFFKRYHRFGALIAGSILVFVSHNMINNFVFQIMESKGGDSASMGTVMGLAAACELPTMLCFVWMVKKVSSGTWLRVSGLFFALKALGTLLAPNTATMYLVQLLQMFGFALFVVASVYYVNQMMEERDRVKGQAYMTVTNTLGGVLGSLCGGALIDAMGVHTMLLLSTIVAVAGMIIMWVATNPRRAGKSNELVRQE